MKNLRLADRQALRMLKGKTGFCPCGSGNPKQSLYDGHGIFLSYYCDDCEQVTLEKFRPDILDNYDTDEQIEDDY